MSTTADIKNGSVINFKNARMKIVEFQHVKPGKGPAFVRTKLKNIQSGKIIDHTTKQDILFHAKRAIQEFSYDVSRVEKIQEIQLGTSLSIPMPQDYVNYVQLSIVDNGGIEAHLQVIGTGTDDSSFILSRANLSSSSSSMLTPGWESFSGLSAKTGRGTSDTLNGTLAGIASNLESSITSFLVSFIRSDPYFLS